MKKIIPHRNPLNLRLWLPVLGVTAVILLVPLEYLRAGFIHPDTGEVWSVSDLSVYFWKAGMISLAIIAAFAITLWPKTEPKPKKKPETAPISKAIWIVILCVALALRIFRLNNSLIYDEIFYARTYVVQSWWTIPFAMFQPNNHLLYTWLAKAATAVGGWNAVALRLPAALTGLIAIPFTVFIARDWFNVRRPWAAGLLMAAAPFAIEASQSARGYSAMISGAAATMWFFKRALDSGRTKDWGGYIACGALTLGFQIYSIFVIAAQAIWMIYVYISNRKKSGDIENIRRAALSVLLVLAITFALYAGGAEEMYKYAAYQGHNIKLRVNFQFLLELVNSFGMGSRIVVVPWLCFALALCGAGATIKKRRAELFLAATPFLLGLVGAKISRTFVFARFFSFFLPFYLVLIWVGVEALLEKLKRVGKSEKIIAALVLLVLTASALYQLIPYYKLGRQNFKDAAAYIGGANPRVPAIATGLGKTEIRFYNPDIFASNSDEDMLKTCDKFGATRIVGTFPNSWNANVLKFIESSCSVEKVFPSCQEPLMDVSVYFCARQK